MGVQQTGHVPFVNLDSAVNNDMVNIHGCRSDKVQTEAFHKVIVFHVEMR